MTWRLLVELKVALPGDKSYSWYENTFDSGVYKRLCDEFGVSPDTDWGQKLDHGCQGLGVRIRSRRAPMHITLMAPSLTRRTPYDITGIYWGRGRCSFPINQKASLKSAWSASTTAYGRMFRPSWGRNPRHVQKSSNPERDSTLGSSA